MTEVEERVARAQWDLMDCFLRRFDQIEHAMRVANIPLSLLDQESIHAVGEWISARQAQRRAEADDPRR